MYQACGGARGECRIARFLGGGKTATRRRTSSGAWFKVQGAWNAIRSGLAAAPVQ